MLKSILDKAIGEEADIKWFGKLNYDDKEAFRRRADTDADADLIYWGYNLAKAEMRAKIPQVVEEFAGFIIDKFGGMDGNTFKLGKTEIEIIKSLTENR